MELTGAEIVIECLKKEGIDYVFGYPGGAVLHIYDAFYKQQDVQQIEEYYDAPIEELEEDELDEAISELGIQEEPLDASDEAALAAAG